MITEHCRHFSVEETPDRVVTVRIDVADCSVNVFNTSVIDQLERIVDDLESELPAAVIFRSSKPSGFFAGADVRQIAGLKSRGETGLVIRRGQALFRRIERLPFPTIAAIHGPCLGGGLEFALACRFRIAMDSNRTRLGLPETQLGLIPGWGGTQRLPKLVGLSDALTMILKAKKLTARDALAIGLVDAVGDESDWDDFVTRFAETTAGETRKAARRSVLALLADMPIGQWLVFREVEKKIARDAKNYPALPAAVRAVRAAFDSDKDGYDVEREEFTKLIETPTCRNLLDLFFRREKARAADVTEFLSEDSAGDVRVSPDPPAKICRIGVVGAGAMGAGIGQLAALKGFDVVLKELTPDLAAAGKDRVSGLLNEMVARRRLSEAECRDVLSRVTAGADFDCLADCDLVIEAVVEKADVKRKVFRELDRVLKPHAIIVSNTSALSVSEMAAATQRPGKVAGLHFFNPVHRMDLVEVVRAAHTNADTISALLMLVRKLGKTPIVTSDSPGFLVNRVLFPYIGEAVRMVTEGIDCREIDREAKRFGMPMGPIELVDHVGIDVAWHVAMTLENVLPDSQDLIRLLGKMTALRQVGRKSGRGFYEYTGGKRGRVADIPPVDVPITSATGRTQDSDCSHPSIGIFLADDLSDIQRRLIYSMINEVGFCLQEGVVSEPWMADLAMVLGTGFAPFRGGPVALARTIGHSTLVNNLHVLTARHGDRFKPSAWLVDRKKDSTHVANCEGDC